MSTHKDNAKIAEIQAILENYVVEANQECAFSQRDTRLNEVRFVEVLVLGWLREGTASLNKLASYAQDLGVQITGSALHERIGSRAIALLGAVLGRSLHEVVQGTRLDVAVLAQFSAVHITDSTQISLPQQLSEEFKGNNGDAKLKLQVTFNYSTGAWVGLEIMSGKTSDQKSELPLLCAREGSLNIQDLGYFKQERLRDIDQQGAFFVSRYQSQTALYKEATDQRLELVKHLRSLSADEWDTTVLLGGRVKHPVRLVARRLPQELADARRRKAKKKAREQGKTCRADYLYLLGWDILVTNLTADTWLFDQIFNLYALRMQIEWVFRIWKSQLKVDHFGKNWRRERVLCQLYAHLIGILLYHRLTQGWLWHNGDEYSMAKCSALVQQHIAYLMQCIKRCWYGSRAWLRRLEDSFKHFGRKTNRKKEPSTLQILMAGGLS